MAELSAALGQLRTARQQQHQQHQQQQEQEAQQQTEQQQKKPAAATPPDSFEELDDGELLRLINDDGDEEAVDEGVLDALDVVDDGKENVPTTTVARVSSALEFIRRTVPPSALAPPPPPAPAVPTSTSARAPAPAPAPIPVLAVIGGALGDHAVARRSPPQRRFPGPAGALPPLSDDERRRVLRSAEASRKLSLTEMGEGDAKATESPLKKLKRSTAMLHTEPVDLRLFQRGAWATMVTVLDVLAGSADEPRRSPLEEHNIAQILRQHASAKVPNLVVYVKELRTSGGDAWAKLVDPTGEIQGTIHKRVLDDFAKMLTVGSVLQLQRVSVFHPSPRTKYLTITRDNVVRVFPSEPDTPRASQAGSSAASAPCGDDAAPAPAPAADAPAPPAAPPAPPAPPAPASRLEDDAELAVLLEAMDDNCFDVGID